MSCADVCIDHDYDDENAFYRETTPTARTPHTCCECRAVIPVGARYERAAGKSGGGVWTATSCARCAEIRHAFVCGGFRFGDLWESIEESIFPIWEASGPIDCLAKLTTLDARNTVREHYRDWKAETTA